MARELRFGQHRAVGADAFGFHARNRLNSTLRRVTDAIFIETRHACQEAESRRKENSEESCKGTEASTVRPHLHRQGKDGLVRRGNALPHPTV